ncbi:exo-beta-N-acetylmuramidase NamZ family protein [Psychrosphaera saromensis]|uniref:DUF1343 domain-containing protein n=1 Tax=Psychrosphaera saromensis TaxID=716813 RepID=A0A2S7UUN7_9GAMM|nr:DUF1343 domain-containing protein [Psychrosphaera saromensis]PQJ53445.1 hypothetical protein BTO11_07050 [Psychrosphaera saromensis]
MFNKENLINKLLSSTWSFSLFLVAIFILNGCASNPKVISPSQIGAEQTATYFPLLKGKRIGVVVNQTSRVKDMHLVDLLNKNGFDVKTIFAPEHGFRGDHSAGELVNSSIDAATGINIVSIYGKYKKPTDELMSQLDIIIFDIQDVGVRFYTYISSMHYMMQAAAENNVEFMVLDRPNPNLQYIDGPILEPEFRSFVGMHPIPLSHGMTVGELAKMIVGEAWLSIESKKVNFDYKLKLTVIPVQDYQRQDTYVLPVAPSPNLPNQQAINLYPSLCLFEATPVSVGRGTDFPFQVLGHNTVIEHSKLGDFTFTPRVIKGVSKNPKLKGVLLTGQNLTQTDIKGFDLSLFFNWYQVFEQNKTEFFQRPDFMDKLAGTDKLRKAMLAGQSLATIKQSWQTDLTAFKQQRKPYLLY